MAFNPVYGKDPKFLWDQIRSTSTNSKKNLFLFLVYLSTKEKKIEFNVYDFLLF